MARKSKEPNAKALKAAQMLADGATTREMMEATGYKSPQACRRAALQALNYRHFEDIQKARVAADRRMERISEAMVMIMSDKKAERRDQVAAARTLLTVEHRRARTFGTDAPKFIVPVDAPKGTTDLTAEELVKECQRHGTPVPHRLEELLAQRSRNNGTGDVIGRISGAA